MILPVRIEYARMGIIDCSRGSTTSWYSMTIGTLRKSMSWRARYMWATLDVHHWKMMISASRIWLAALIHDTGLYQSSTSTTSTSDPKDAVDRHLLPVSIPGKFFWATYGETGPP